ncbi:chromate transporter [Neisseria canis]|uniref:chromate transporter n=1 Tax=Neisseria canis TaxID=493 RepID=UPI002012B0F5|nr:chromate transporter [Neisseria canis]
MTEIGHFCDSFQQKNKVDYSRRRQAVTGYAKQRKEFTALAIGNQHIFNTRQQAVDSTDSTGLILLLLQQLTKSFSLSQAVVLPLLQAQTVPLWLSNDTFLAGYGAAQAVPGPLFTFAAFLGHGSKRPARRHGGFGFYFHSFFFTGVRITAFLE